MPVRRSKFYVGAGESVSPANLAQFEDGGHIAEPKWDGMFASLEVGEWGNVLRSRDTLEGRIIDGERSGGIEKLLLWAPGTVVIGELEAASQAATEAVVARGYRKLYVYDILRAAGDPVAQSPWDKRREILEEWHSKLSADAKQRVELTPFRRSGFKAYFDEVMASGGEGLIIKRVASSAEPTRLSGKIDAWFKCKVESTYDYVLIGEELTPKLKQKTGVLGLWDEAKRDFRRCLICSVPEALLKPENYGKTVVEVMAFQRFKSGSARSARFVRVRSDREAQSVSADQAG